MNSYIIIAYNFKYKREIKPHTVCVEYNGLSDKCDTG